MLWQTELIHGAHLGVDNAEDEIDTEPLAHHAGAETTELIGVGKICVAALVQLRLLQVGEEFLRERERIVRSQRRSVGPDRLQSSVQTPERRRVHTKMNIGRASFLPDRQILIDVSE